MKSIGIRAERLCVALLAGTLAVLGACSRDSSVTAPAVESVSMCRTTSSSTAAIVSVPLTDVAARKAQGDYVTSVTVDPATTRGGDSIHYKRIGDAVSAVRALRLSRHELSSAACVITIDVAAGTYHGSLKPTTDPALETFPITLDVPAVRLHGALAMTLDAASRATGVGQSTAASTLSPTSGMTTAPLPQALVVVNAHPNGSAGNQVTIEGFVMQSGHIGVDADSGGYGVFAMRVANLVIRGNRFEPALSSAIDVRATDARVENNWMGGGVVCDVCLAGPGTFTVSGNRITSGGIDGVVLSSLVILAVPDGVEQYDLPASAKASASIFNNEIRDHLRVPVGVAVRAMAMSLGGPNVPQATTLDIHDNDLTHNMFALLYEAGFPLANTLLKGDLNVTLSNNKIQGSCQADLMVTFNRHATTLGVAQLTRPYLRNSTYTVSLGSNLSWDNVWYSDPDGLGNTLIVDGKTIAAGSKLAYSATKVCP
jgi:hypothetical protein